MRKKLDTRFPAARIKKIMQADDDVGKIAMATPVLISKALELFLQDLCDRTYEITLNRGAKTMNSRHLKECVHTHSVFDFLRETVSRVPDIGSDTGGENARRRKTSDADHDDSCDEDGKRPRGELVAPVIVTSKGRGGRGRGRGRGRRSSREKSKIGEDREEEEALSSPQASDSAEDGPPFLSRESLPLNEGESSEAAAAVSSPKRHLKDFDLNMDLNENGEVAAVVEPVAIAGEEEEGVVASLPLLHHQDSNPLQQEEEDYDCEDED